MEEVMSDRLRKNDGTLDYYILVYCKVNDILADGDVFGVAFSGADDYTVAHATELIEMFADLYCLRPAKVMTL